MIPEDAPWIMAAFKDCMRLASCWRHIAAWRAAVFKLESVDAPKRQMAREVEVYERLAAARRPRRAR